MLCVVEDVGSGLVDRSRTRVGDGVRLSARVDLLCFKFPLGLVVAHGVLLRGYVSKLALTLRPPRVLFNRASHVV